MEERRIIDHLLNALPMAVVVGVLLTTALAYGNIAGQHADGTSLFNANLDFYHHSKHSVA